jgi:hypothetical protein
VGGADQRRVYPPVFLRTHQWEVPDAILAGGRQGWPFILSSLKSVLETGNPIVTSVPMGPPKGMLDAVKEACATKPWLTANQ